MKHLISELNYVVFVLKGIKYPFIFSLFFSFSFSSLFFFYFLPFFILLIFFSFSFFFFTLFSFFSNFLNIKIVPSRSIGLAAPLALAELRWWRPRAAPPRERGCGLPPGKGRCAACRHRAQRKECGLLPPWPEIQGATFRCPSAVASPISSGLQPPS